MSLFSKILQVVRKISILLICLLFFSTLLELSLRFAGHILASRRDVLVSNRGDAFGVGEKVIFSKDKEDDGKQVTILCLGDSFTFGGNVKEKACYPYQLWKMLASNYGKSNVKVVNKGHCEYNSNQVLRDFQDNIKQFSPNIVILLVGSSDKFNLIGSDSSNAGLIYEPDYEEGRASSASISDNGFRLKDTVLDLRVYKMLRIIGLNIKKAIVALCVSSNRSEPAISCELGIDSIELRKIMKNLENYYYQCNHEMLLETALEAIRKWPNDKEHYLRGVGNFFVLSWAYSFQKKYDSRYVLDAFDRMREQRPEFNENEVFLKYYCKFESQRAFDSRANQRLIDNLESMARICEKHNIVLLIQNYPCLYSEVNQIIENLANKYKLLLVDNYNIFSELIREEGKGKYLTGDDHCTPEGYRVVAQNAYAAIKSNVLIDQPVDG